MTEPKPKLRWFQYSLRTLFVVLTLFAILCSWLSVKMRQAKRERDAAAVFEKLSATVEWSPQSGPAWLRKLLGVDVFAHVESVKVGVYPSKMTDTDLENIEELGQLRDLFLCDVNITDNGLKHIRRLSQLRELCLRYVNVTDNGLENIKGLSHIRRLWLVGIPITDAGLEKLSGLSQLKTLFCDGTKVTAEGVKKLRQALPNCEITTNWL